MSLVKPGGAYASVSGLPERVKEHPDIRAWKFQSRPDARRLADLGRAVAAGNATLAIGACYPLRLAATAHTALERGGAGKIILIP
jgi:NADPH:quinone reductase-like Zn-dependent oxidoreductase